MPESFLTDLDCIDPFTLDFRSNRMAKKSASPTDQNLQPQRKQLFTLGAPLDSAQIKGELDGLLHFAEGVALLFGQTGIRNSLALAQTLVDDDDLRDRVVADVNAYKGLDEPTANVPEPGTISDQPQAPEEWAQPLPQ